MTIVELIDVHNGFDIITARIRQTDKRRLLWTIAFITFFLSAVLDNLTTTIVIISLLRKLIRDHPDRLFFAGIVVVAANAGEPGLPLEMLPPPCFGSEGRSQHIISLLN
jgi:Na+/H+ antiporter NhaD/arsenite permease-like protein